MWQAITEHINSELDSDFQLEHKQQLAGGSINLAWHISNTEQDFFVKINQREQFEQFELNYLAGIIEFDFSNSSILNNLREISETENFYFKSIAVAS